MTAVPQWSGREVRALRAARRMSVREFAAHLGISDRMVSKWEAGGESIRPRSVNQAALDTSLATASAETRTRFERLVGGRAVHIEAVNPGATVRHLLRHPVDDKLMTLVEPGPYAPPHGAASWLPGYFIDVFPTTCKDYAQFVATTGHRAPPQWTDGVYPDGMAETPVQVSWVDAAAYAEWASKQLPSQTQWERAAGGEEGMVAGHLAEWCASPGGPRRQEVRSVTTSGHPAFRCVVAAPELLALMAI